MAWSLGQQLGEVGEGVDRLETSQLFHQGPRWGRGWSLG